MRQRKRALKSTAYFIIPVSGVIFPSNYFVTHSFIMTRCLRLAWPLESLSYSSAPFTLPPHGPPSHLFPCSSIAARPARTAAPHRIVKGRNFCSNICKAALRGIWALLKLHTNSWRSTGTARAPHYPPSFRRGRWVHMHACAYVSTQPRYSS